MIKAEIIALLIAAGITPPSNATVAVLTELAAANNISLEEAPAGDSPEAAAESLSPFEAAAKAEIDAMTPTPAPTGITEEAIREKTAAGLTRDQAIEVLQAQARHDAELAKSEGKA